MTTSPETEPRFGQLRNDIDALYKVAADTTKTVKKIAAVQEEHGRTLESVAEIAAVQQLQGRIQEKHSGRLDRIEATLDVHSEKHDSHTEKLDSHTEKLDSHTKKLDTILGLLTDRPPTT